MKLVIIPWLHRARRVLPRSVVRDDAMRRLHAGPICASMVHMSRFFGLCVIVLISSILLWAQVSKTSAPSHPQWELHSVFPRETSPAMYQQVSQQEIEGLAAQGWELVSVVPYVIRNEERGSASTNRPAVTQTYPAYFFKRAKLAENVKH